MLNIDIGHISVFFCFMLGNHEMNSVYFIKSKAIVFVCLSDCFFNNT